MAVSVRVHSHVILLLLFIVTIHSNYAFGRNEYDAERHRPPILNNFGEHGNKYKIISTLGSQRTHKERKNINVNQQRIERKRQPFKISESRECKTEVSLYCSKNSIKYGSNIETLECLQNDFKVRDTKLTFIQFECITCSW